ATKPLTPVSSADTRCFQFDQIALAMVSRGIPVVPVPPGEKGPRLKNWQHLATTDMGQVRKWHQEYRNYGCAAVATPHGYWFLDCDDPNLPKRIEDETGKTLPSTLSVKSSKGLHLYFKQTDA